MKRTLSVVGAGITLAVLMLAAGPRMALAGSLVSELATDKAYSLQIIAHDKCPAGTFDSSNRRSIAVQADFSKIANNQDLNSLTKVNSIFLTPSTDGTFQVLDGNACDSDGAQVQLPETVSTTYELWVRLVGKPGSTIDVTACATLLGQTTIICSTDNFAKTRMTGKGQPSFTDATSKLLSITNPLLTSTTGTTCDSATEPLFSGCLDNFFWNWDTTGRPHAQVWFVPLPQ
jgi:hypothetical protein